MLQNIFPLGKKSRQFKNQIVLLYTVYYDYKTKKILHNICVCLHVAYTSMKKKNTLKIKQFIDISYFGVMNQVPKHTNYDISHFFDFNSRSILWTVCVSLLKMCVKCWNVRRVRHFLFELRMPMVVVGWKCVEIIAWCIRII